VKREYAINLKDRLKRHEYIVIGSLKELASFADEIKSVIIFIDNKKPKEAPSLQLSYGQLTESLGYLESWIKNPDKSRMPSFYNEYKGDFLSVLDDYITAGDTYNLWEDM